MPIWHQSPKLTPRYFLETPRLFGYPNHHRQWRKISASALTLFQSNHCFSSSRSLYVLYKETKCISTRKILNLKQ